MTTAQRHGSQQALSPCEAVMPVAVTNQASEGRLLVSWSSGHTTTVSHAVLRRACRCAECVSGLTAVKDTREARIKHLELVGQYALTFRFDDGHERGIYPWNYLWTLSLEHADNGAALVDDCESTNQREDASVISTADVKPFDALADV